MNNASIWYAAQLRKNALQLAQLNLKNQNFETFAPVRESRSGATKKVTKSLKSFFPGYIFVGVSSKFQRWHAINSTYGVSSLVMMGDRPVRVPDEFIAALKSRCDEDGILLPAPDLEVGHKVRIQSGHFADLVAQIEQLRGLERVVLLVDLLTSSVRVETQRINVERLAEASQLVGN